MSEPDPWPAATPAPSEAELVDAAKRGDRGAFEALARQVQGRIYRHCLRLTGEPETSRDLTQDVLLRMFRALGRFRPEHAFYTWVYRITANRCIDHLRSRGTRLPGTPPRLPVAGFPDGSEAELAAGAPTPEEVLLGTELRRAIHRAIAALPPPLEEVVRLKDVQGHSTAEIAQALGCTPGTVKMRIFRGRHRLRAALRPRLG